MLGGGTGAPAAQPTAVPAAKASTKIVAEAIVEPIQTAKLSLGTAGLVTEVPVKLGDRVQAGQVIAKLDTVDFENAVRRAEAAVKIQEASLAKAKVGARAEDITAAEAKVGVAEAAVQAAEGRLTATRARAGDSQAAITSAQGRLAAAQAGLQKTTASATAEDIAIAERKIEQAKNSLWGAQAQRDATCGPSKKNDAIQAACDKAKADTQAAEEGVRLAELELQKLQAGARDADIKSAQASITQGQGDVAGAQARARAATGDIEAAEGDVANAQANLEAAKAELERAKVGARSEDIAVVEAQLAEAQAALKTAKSELDKAALKAPFAGTIVSLDLKVGERVQPGTVVIQLADLSQFKIETTDLTELNVVRLKPGDAATVTFDAIPGLELPGKITRINDLGENKQGDIVYTVVITPDTADERLRWKMTASATFEPGR